MGLQETRTEMGSSFNSHILRLASGCERGQFGVELWANLNQPFAWQGHQPLFLALKDFVVVSTNSRHLLLRVCNQYLDLWFPTAHAPHSGLDAAVRDQWWDDINSLVRVHVLKWTTGDHD